MIERRSSSFQRNITSNLNFGAFSRRASKYRKPKFRLTKIKTDDSECRQHRMQYQQSPRILQQCLVNNRPFSTTVCCKTNHAFHSFISIDPYASLKALSNQIPSNITQPSKSKTKLIMVSYFWNIIHSLTNILYWIKRISLSFGAVFLPISLLPSPFRSRNKWQLIFMVGKTQINPE
jgi:hypothetical protein